MLTSIELQSHTCAADSDDLHHWTVRVARSSPIAPNEAYRNRNFTGVVPLDDQTDLPVYLGAQLNQTRFHWERQESTSATLVSVPRRRRQRVWSANTGKRREIERSSSISPIPIGIAASITRNVPRLTLSS